MCEALLLKRFSEIILADLAVCSIKTNTNQVTPRSSLFPRKTTGEALISAMPWRMHCLRSSLEATRICQKNFGAIFEKAHSIRFNHEPCLGV